MVHFIYIKVKGVTPNHVLMLFMADFLMLNDSVKCPNNKYSKYKIMLAEKLKLLANNFSLLSFFPIFLFCLFVICLNVSFITPVPHVLCYLFGCLDSYV